MAPAYWQLVLMMTRSAPGEPIKSYGYSRSLKRCHCTLHTTVISTALLKREFLVGAVDGEVETLVIVVGVRVGGTAGSAALVVVGAGSVGSGTDLGSSVGGGAAGGGRLADLEGLALRPLDGAGDGKAEKRSQGNEGLDERQ